MRWIKDPFGVRLLQWGSAVLLVLGSVLWGGWTFIEEKQRATLQAYERVALVRQYTQRLVQTQTILQDAAEIHANSYTDAGYLRSEAFHRFLAKAEASQAFTYGVAVVGLDGTLIASSRSFPATASFGQRDYITAVAGGSGLVVDRLWLEPGGEDAFIVAQSFHHQSFSGAIVSAVAITAVRDFLASVASRPGEAASLLRSDGKLLVRNIPSAPSRLDASTPAARAIAAAPSGHYEATAVFDGVRRVFAYAELAGLPVYSTFGIPVKSIWASWFWRSLPGWVLMCGGAVFSWALGALISRSIKERSDRDEQLRLRRDAEQKAAQHTHFMRELNHRVKNNLALIDSMISLQVRRNALDGPTLRARIRAIAEVHDLLYRTADSYHVDLGELLQQLSASPALVPAERDISVVCETDEGVIIDAGRATPIALVVVELITNAVKHAFPDNAPGRISVSLVAEPMDKVVLTVRDDGIGLPAESTRRSGISIVRAFVAQIGGQLDHPAGPGAAYRITLSLRHGGTDVAVGRCPETPRSPPRVHQAAGKRD